MDQFFLDAAYKASKTITNHYSTSFSSGIRIFDESLRDPIYGIYGFVRFADEIVDAEHNENRRAILDEFWDETQKAIKQRFSMNPVLHAFQDTVHKYDIDFDFIEAFVDSMYMDIDPRVYDRASYEKYIYGSAEVVGLMCLRVFLKGREQAFDALVPHARALGSAFQKINFLRDIKSDYVDRGRTYFPGIDVSKFNQAQKQEIEDEIQKEFDYAYIGIKQLPMNCRLGVLTAYYYYLELLSIIKKQSPDTILNARMSVPNWRKVQILCTTYLRKS